MAAIDLFGQPLTSTEASTIPQPFVDATEEYSKILKALKDDQMSKDNAYALLMKKEENVLETVNRVASNEQRATQQKTLFYNLPLITILALFTNTWKNIFLEIVIFKQYTSLQAIYEVFTKHDRKLYVGIMVAFIAIFLYIIDIV